MKLLFRTSATALLIIGLTMNFSCEKDEDLPQNEIKAGIITIEDVMVNCCQLSNGLTGTQFTYSIPWEAPEGVKIVKVEYKTTRSNGTANNGEFSTTIDGIDGIVNAYITLVFTNSSWVESSIVLVGSSGQKSKPSVIRFDRPPGAN